MLEGNDRRKRRPPVKKFDEPPESQLTKLTEMGFVSFVSSDDIAFMRPSSPSSDCDHAAWKEEFHRWMLVRCTYKGRCFGGIEQLYANFREWCVSVGEVPCPSSGFVALLSEDGYFFANGLISGVVLREDRKIGRGAQKPRMNA
jgi:hypothetical protein